jgi:hypothetical protein
VNEQKTDRELLGAAARAAGINISYWHSDGSPMVRDDGGYPERWNPIANDGDAFRLAVKLGLTVIAGMARDEEGRLSMGDANEDCSAATRRAIVHAAAQIGAAATGGRE